MLALANKIVQVSRDERLDIVHAHYAVPHATAAYLARQILAATNGRAVPRVITTLHGTDITLLAADRSYSEIIAFSIQQSDGVTAVSESLKATTHRELGQICDIRVIPNFVDGESHRRQDRPELRAQLAAAGEKLIIHVSNFRPVKRVTSVIEIFRQIRLAVPSRLLMVGDGPDLAEAVRLTRKHGLTKHVQFLGDQEQVVPLLSVSDLFLMPSVQESFGSGRRRRDRVSLCRRRPRRDGSGRHSPLDRRTAASADGAGREDEGGGAVRRHEDRPDVRGLLR